MSALFEPAKLTRDFVAFRRASFFGAIVGTTALGAWTLWKIFEPDGISKLEWIQLVLFVLLFQQIATGFWLALFGFFTVLAGGDHAQISHSIGEGDSDEVTSAATAIVIPIYNEDAARVFGGIEAMWRGLTEGGKGTGIDLFILSDSNRPETWLREETEWFNLCKKLDAFGRIHYRKRRVPRNGKSGNVADFCRRWGAKYQYMIVLDADSVVTGRLLRRLVAMMEKNPRVGLIQTAPQLALGRTPFRRMQQFAARLYAPLFAAGANYWHLFGANYWGHNAIIRLKPFIENCDLPDLPDPDSRRKHIFSHDTVEAALMRKAGYDVWFAYAEDGSYEEGPPNLSNSLARDRRWCMGNLQHFWFLFAPRIDFANRLHIWMGVMGYFSSLLWLLFLIAGAVDLAVKRQISVYSASTGEIITQSGEGVQILLIATFALLFVPKILSMLVALPRARKFGGAMGLISSTVVETAVWTLLAPAVMIYYTQFVILTLSGITVKWESQNRSDDVGIGFLESFRIFYLPPLLGVIAVAALWRYGREELWLMSPIILGWLLVPVIAWATSQPKLGDWARRRRLFVTPEELPKDCPQELEDVSQIRDGGEREWSGLHTGLSKAVIDPMTNAMHVALLRRQKNSGVFRTREYLNEQRSRLLKEGPQALNVRQQFALLWDADSLLWLHREFWSSPAEALHPWWRMRLEETVGGKK